MQKANVLISKSDSRMKNAGTKKAPFQGLCGVPGATRTPGLPLRRRSLYPTELREHGLWGVAQGECTSSALGVKRVVSQRAQIVQWDMAERRYLGTF